VLAQTHSDIEIIIVNDGSTDNTDAIVKSHLLDSRVRYIRQSNAGQANAKNTGIKNSFGEFIAFLDADDVWEKDKLEKQLLCFTNPDVGVVYCRAKYLDEDSNIIDFEMTPAFLQPRRGKVTEWLILDNFVQFSSSIVRRQCLERFGGFDESLKMGIDWDLWLRFSTAYQFDFVDERLFYYRMGHSGQMSKNLEERHRCSDRIMEKFLKDYPGILTPQIVRQTYAVNFCNRGSYLRQSNLKESTSLFIDAVRMNPFEAGAYRGLAKNLLAACGMLRA
jgi:glycosyltransferase involved in cell wall biosynthesis